MVAVFNYHVSIMHLSCLGVYMLIYIADDVSFAFVEVNTMACWYEVVLKQGR